MQRDVRISLREPETQLTHSRTPPTMKLMSASGKFRDAGAHQGPERPRHATKQRQTDLLGSARLDADAGARYLALRREYRLSRIVPAGRAAFFPCVSGS